MQDGGDKVPADVKSEAEAAVTQARTAMEGQDASALKSASDRLTQSAMKIGEAVYKAQGAAEAGAPAGDASASAAGAGKPGDTVVDAEFEEVPEQKKKAS